MKNKQMYAFKGSHFSYVKSYIYIYFSQGGQEHGVPIVISEIHPYLPAWRSGMLFVGDAILSVNGIDLGNMKHNDAARTLSTQVLSY